MTTEMTPMRRRRASPAATTGLHGRRNLRRSQEERRNEEIGISGAAFRVHRVTSTASVRSTTPLLEYSKKSYWESYARATESIVLALETKTLLSEICILNKNACTVDVSIAVDDRPRSYVPVARMQHMPHSREVRIKVGFFPCSFVRLDFSRLSQPSIAIYGIKLLGVASRTIEQDSGPSVCNQLSHTTEHLLYGPSLRESLPYRDCLSEDVSGSLEWMERQRHYVLDEKIARLERTLFSFSN